MHLAWVSPLPPARSGIADYSAELLPALLAGAEVSLFAPEPWAEIPLSGVPCYPLAALPDQADTIDLIVYHLGNNYLHTGIYDLALRLPGVVVLHDYVLHHMVARCTIQAGDTVGYIWHLAYERGRRGAAMAIRRVHGVFSEREQFLDPLNRVLLDRSRGVIVHSNWSAERIGRDHAGLPVGIVPHHLASIPSCPREQFRRELGIAPGEIVLASFGFVSRQKRVESMLEAYGHLRQEYPQVRCFLVGEPESGLDLADMLFSLGVQDEVVVTGYVDLEHFYRYIAACDIAVNLRYPSAGETSGALVRLLGSGKAVIVSNLHQFAEWPDDVCLKVDPGPAEGPMLLYYLRRLVQDEGLRQQLGENARRYAEANHSLERSAEGYLEFCRRLLHATPMSAGFFSAPS